MNPQTNLKPAPFPARNSVSSVGPVPKLDIVTLKNMAAKALLALFDGKELLFSRRITLREGGFRREAASQRRTVIALLGLKCLSDSDQQQPFDLASIENSVFQDKSWIKGIGDSRDLLQFAAEYSPDRLTSLADDFDFAKALETFPDGREARTVALSCFLAGVSRAKLSCSGVLPDLTDVAVSAYHLLEENRGTSGNLCTCRISWLISASVLEPFWNHRRSNACDLCARYIRACI